MKQFNSQILYISCFIATAFLPAISTASDSWTGFVPPAPAQIKPVSMINQNKWHKSTWRTGANFKSHNMQQFETSPSNIVDAKEYALTKPQRKSVNPWHVNSSWSSNRQYKFGPTIRPWGSVPEQFQKRATSRQVFQPAGRNRNFIPPSQAYRPYVNSNLLNHSGSLLPVGGYLPFYGSPTYINNSPLFSSPYGYSNAYLWR